MTDDTLAREDELDTRRAPYPILLQDIRKALGEAQAIRRDWAVSYAPTLDAVIEHLAVALWIAEAFWLSDPPVTVNYEDVRRHLGLP